jgi:hypothetical protein
MRFYRFLDRDGTLTVECLGCGAGALVVADDREGLQIAVCGWIRNHERRHQT